MRMFALLLAVTLTSGCASTVRINSDPQGAKVTIDERSLGTTPVTLSDAGPFWAKRTLRLRKEGYREKEAVLIKDEVRVGPLIGAILVAVPIFWITGYPEQVTYELDPVE